MSELIKHLDQSDRFHTEAASGWLGLGNIEEAHNELEQISKEMRTHPTVLLARCEIYMAAKKWENVISITGDLVKRYPELDQPWILRSYSLHELKRTQESFDHLLPAARRFEQHWLVRYNLACYCSCLGRLKEAKRWLDEAFMLSDEKDIRQQALDDPDLKPLWNKIGKP